MAPLARPQAPPPPPQQSTDDAGPADADGALPSHQLRRKLMGAKEAEQEQRWGTTEVSVDDWLG